MRINDNAPDFTAETTQGRIRFHEWMGDSWAVLFSHPKDFTPVCTTELGYMASIADEFARRDCRIIAVSTDVIDDHKAWIKEINQSQDVEVNYPLISDSGLDVAKLYDMLPADAAPGPRTAGDNATVRSVVVIGPDKRVKATIAYPMTTGRNFDEVLRLLDSLQMTATADVATPVNWTPGDEVVIPPSVTNEEAHRRYPQGWRTVTPYLRLVQPNGA